MKAKIPVSVYIITLNEEANIGRALDCLGDFDEVVIVDSGSSDRTVEIAESRGNTRVSFREFDGFAAHKSHALSLCRNEWALNLDADEELTEEYIAEVRKIVAQDEFDALESTRTLIRWGARPRHFGGAERLIRLFRKSAGHYPPRRVHESIHIDGRVAKTSATILHHENLTFSQRVAKSKRYAEARARDKFDRGDKAPLPVLLLIFPLSFIQHYVFKGHILDGVDGLLTSMNSAYYAFIKYARLWELYRGRE